MNEELRTLDGFQGGAALGRPPNPPPRVPDHELVRRVGHGSYGEVWLARNAVGGYRAVKVVYEARFESARPFDREFNGIQKFEPISRSNEGFVHVLQVGRNEGQGYFYYVMELADDANAPSGPQVMKSGGRAVPGSAGPFNPAEYVPKTLALVRSRQTRLRPDECLELGIRLSQALEHLHGSGLIHRDIKPANIILVNGAPKLADIGLVAELSQARSYVGTEGFMPDEGPNSAGADVYSLGKVLYEIVTGKDRHDFPEPSSELGEGPQPGLLRELNVIILKACDPDPRRRYQSAGQMHDELLLLRGGMSVQKKRATDRRTRILGKFCASLLCCTLVALGVERVLDWRVQSVLRQNSGLHPRLSGKVRAREPNAPRETLDLTAQFNAPLTERWYPGPADNTLAALPNGVQTFAGVKFDVRGLVQLSGLEISGYGADLYPPQARIPVHRWAKRLHFLQGALSEMVEGSIIGKYQVRYASGKLAEIPIQYGSNILALWQPARLSGVLSNSVLAWTGENPPARARQMALRLYRMSWDNARTADEILAVDFVSALRNSAPLLVALTFEEDAVAAQQRKPGLDLVKAMQAHAGSFARLGAGPGAGHGRLQSFRLNTRSLVLAGKHYDGLRLAVPAGGCRDLVWAFRAPAGGQFGSWYVTPTEGRMKVGFEDWYHGIGARAAPSPGIIVQYLDGKKLRPGQEYIIWFDFPDDKPFELEATASFAQAGQADPNNPDSLVNVLQLADGSQPSVYKFHRHYCLGSLR